MLGWIQRYLLFFGVVILITTIPPVIWELPEASANHEDAVRIEAALRGDPQGTLFPNASGNATFVRTNTGWDFSVFITGGEANADHDVVFYQLDESALPGTPFPISGREFARCVIHTDASGSGSCSGHLDNLPEPAEIVVFLASQEGVLLGANWQRGDFTFITEQLVPTATPTGVTLPETGTGGAAGSSAVRVALLALTSGMALTFSVLLMAYRRA